MAEALGKVQVHPSYTPLQGFIALFDRGFSACGTRLERDRWRLGGAWALAVVCTRYARADTFHRKLQSDLMAKVLG